MSQTESPLLRLMLLLLFRFCQGYRYPMPHSILIMHHPSGSSRGQPSYHDNFTVSETAALCIVPQTGCALLLLLLLLFYVSGFSVFLGPAGVKPCINMAPLFQSQSQTAPSGVSLTDFMLCCCYCRQGYCCSMPRSILMMHHPSGASRGQDFYIKDLA